jgi:hypothetical protein
MPRRIDFGRAVLVAGAVLLLISLFNEWYDTGPTGWDVFETLDIVLAGIAVAAIAAAIRPEAVPPGAAWGLPAAALVIVLVQLIDAPPAAGGGQPSTGAWLALAGSVLMAAGAALSLAAVSVTIQVRERETRRRVSAVDRRGEAEGVDDAAGAARDARGPEAAVRRGGRLGIADDRIGEDDPDAGPRGTRRRDPERTQPLTDLPRDEEDAERP